MLSAGVYQLAALNTDSIFTELNQLDCKKSHWQVPEMSYWARDAYKIDQKQADSIVQT